MKSKEQTRDDLKLALATFFAKGGKIKNLKPKKLPINRRVTA